MQRDVCVAARGPSTAVPLLLLRRRLLLWRSAPLWALARALWHTDCAAAARRGSAACAAWQPARLGSLRGSAARRSAARPRLGRLGRCQCPRPLGVRTQNSMNSSRSLKDLGRLEAWRQPAAQGHVRSHA